MEEVDAILIFSLNSLGGHFEDYTNLRQFQLEDVVKGVVLCLKAIDNSCALSTRLPSNMSQRFQTAASIAEKIKDIGYSTDFGYQCILYPNEADIRKLFVYLIEKLPKEMPSVPELSFTKIFLVQKEVWAKLAAELSRCWVPPHCRQVARTYRNAKAGPAVTSYGIYHCTGFTCVSCPTIQKYSSLKNSNLSKFKTQLLRHHSQQLAIERIAQLGHSKEPVSNKLEPLSLYAVEHSPSQGRLSDVVFYGEETRKDDAKDIQERISVLKDEISALECNISSKQIDVAGAASFSRKLEQSLVKYEKEKEEKEMALQTKRRIAALVPEAEDNVVRLREALEKSEKKMARLRRQWQEHREPLELKILTLKELLERTAVNKGKITSEMEQICEKCSFIEEDLQKKDAQIVHWKTLSEKMPKDTNRSVYTKRIMDISSKIRRQKLEIEKVLSDIRHVQKDINVLSGKIDRTFTVVEETAYSEALHNPKIRPVYRSVVAIHTCCNDLMEILREIRVFQKEIFSLQVQLDNENDKKVAENFEKLRNDLSQIKRENEQLSQKLRLR